MGPVLFQGFSQLTESDMDTPRSGNGLPGESLQFCLLIVVYSMAHDVVHLHSSFQFKMRMVGLPTSQGYDKDRSRQSM